MQDALILELKDHAINRNDENTRRIIKCLGELDEAAIWQRPNAASNSVGNLLLHLCGNIRQYIISSLGRQPDTRERDLEFETTSGLTKAELLAKLIATVDEANQVIRNAGPEEILRRREVQGYYYSGVGIIIHVTEHYSYHTGQIAFWVKLLTNRDLGFYAGVDLNAKNKS